MRLREFLKLALVQGQDYNIWKISAEHRFKLIGREVMIGKCRRTIIQVYDDIIGGVIVNKEVEGFRSWNIQECKLLPIKKRRKK